MGRGRYEFNEMLVHHICAVTLTFGMIISNILGIGVIVAYLHLWVDIPLAVSRCGSCTNYVLMTKISFITMLGVWFWTRIGVFSWLVYHVWTELRYPTHLDDFNTYATLHAAFLTALLICHIYWTYLIVLILKNLVTKGSNTDIQMRVKKDEKQE